MQPNSRILRIVLSILFIFSLILQVGQVNAQRLLAGDRGTIQDLINAAPDGGTVDLPAGIYNETLIINKNLTLNGFGLNQTILQPAGAGQRVITVGTGKNLTIINLQIKNGQQPGGTGGGVYMTDGNLTVDLVIFQNNSAAYGGAIFQETATKSLTISHSYFFDNTASIDGGAIYSKGNTSVNAYLLNNTAGRHGGGIHAQSGSLTILFGKFEQNTATTGNGGGVDVNDSVTINGTVFESNSAGDLGGGISQWNPGKTVSMEAAIFDSNTTINKGAGAYLTSHATISYTKFISNITNSGGTSDTFGGGLYASNGADFTYSKFIDNQVLCSGCSLRMGGGVFTSGVFNGTNLLFARNVAQFGSALFFSNATGWLNHVTIGQPSRENNSAILVNSGSNLTMYNSIVSSYPTGVYIQGTLNEGYNIFFNNQNNFQIDGGTHNVNGPTQINIDPLFKDPTNDDFHLRAFSPAIGTGIDTPIKVIYDLDVKSRNGRWDIGAYQFWTNLYLPLIVK